MKRTTIRAISLLLAICMTLALAGCGKKKTGTDTPTPSAGSSTQTPGTTTQEPVVSEPAPGPVMPEPAANVDPEDMKWGYENDGSNDYVHWYPDGDKRSDYYLMFEDGYLTIDDGGERTNMPMESENGHYVNSFEGDPAVDFVFLDNLTCYDLVGEQWYMSAVYEEAVASLTAGTFYCEAGDQWSFTFYDDGTYSLDFDGEVTEGQWWFNDACTICFMDDYGEAWIEVYYDASSWEITGLEYVSEMYYPRA